MARHELTDEQYERLKPLLPVNGECGGQWRDHRPILNAMLWRLRTGTPWRDIPSTYGPWQTVYDRFNRWSSDGTITKVAEALLTNLDEAGGVDWDLWNIDGTVIRASRAAAGARRDAVKKKSASPRITRWAKVAADSAPRFI
jgi:transposase